MRKSIFALLVALFIFNSSSFVLAEEDVQNQIEQKTTAVSETVPVALKNVTAIEVTGNKAISTNVIVSKMKTRIGSVYQENVISDDLKRLYLLGFFSDIKIDIQDYKNGLKILISVAERPIIEKMSFSGINLITMKDEKLKQQLKSRETQYLDYPSLTEDVRILKKMYEKMGYSQADISYKVDTNAGTNKANIVFTVAEGRKVRVKDILIQGNQAFPEGRILKLLKTKRAWFFNAGVLKEEVLKEDIERVKSFYQREGFTDVVVTYEVNPDVKKSYLLFVVIKITEGKKYLVGSVILQGNQSVSEKEILKSLSDCIPGKVFSREAMKKDVISIQGLYFDRGYISAQVAESTLVNTDSGRVDITYNITENQVAYVDKIKIRGNIKTKDLVIRREMRIHPGERFDGEKLRRSKERLTNLGFFEEISYDTEDTGEANKKNLVVDVKETKTGAFSFGGGYSTVDQFVGFVELEQKNFDWRNWPYFTGAGQNIKLRASIGSLSNGFDLSFTEPWMFDYPVSFGFDLYRRTHTQDSDSGYGYDEAVTGGDLRLGKELSEYLRGDLVYRLDQVDISNLESSTTSQDLIDEAADSPYLVSVITPSLTYDSRDNVFDTRKGNLLTGAFDFAGLGGDKNYTKFFARASHYFPMPRGAVLEVRGRLGLAQPYGDTEKVPISERFFAGGAYTIRGYEERKAGPVDNNGDPLGGASMIVGNIEYTYPLFSFLKVAAFYDVGNVWEKLGDIFSSSDGNGGLNSGGLKSGIGIGLRIKTPIGPIMLDYGFPMDPESGKSDRSKSGRFHFSASHGF